MIEMVPTHFSEELEVDETCLKIKENKTLHIAEENTTKYNMA
jgi:hypothetical protein